MHVHKHAALFSVAVPLALGIEIEETAHSHTVTDVVRADMLSLLRSVRRRTCYVKPNPLCLLLLPQEMPGTPGYPVLKYFRREGGMYQLLRHHRYCSKTNENHFLHIEVYTFSIINIYRIVSSP